jgi:GTPase
VARAHAAGEVLRAEHGPDGTLLEARVSPELAAELAQFARAPEPAAAAPVVG